MSGQSNQNNTASRLGEVKRGTLSEPIRYVFYGVESVGKSTLAAHAPQPIWFDCEDGTGRLDVARYPFRDGPGGHVPQSFDEIRAATRDLLVSAHDYKTLVIDTADRMEALIWQHIVTRDSGKGGRKLASIEDYGYARGFSVALDEWRSYCRELDELRAKRQMSIILLGHATIRTFKNPSGDDYDRWHLRVHDKAAGFLKEWADVVGFCCFEEGGAKLGAGDRAKGFSTGRRLVKLERTAAFDAKSRLALPSEIELAVGDPWAPLARAVDGARNLSAAQLIELVAIECARIGDADLTKRVSTAARGVTDTATLSRYLSELKRRDPTQEVQ